MPVPELPPSPFTLQAESTVRKRLFIGLALGTSCLICLLLLAGWVVPCIGFANIHPSLPYITGALFFGAIVLIASATTCLLVHVCISRPFLWSGRFWAWSTRFLLPLMEIMGRLGGISPTEVRGSFIKVNNELLSTDRQRYKPAEVLVLLPHCIQRATCDLRLSYHIDHCRRCGLCPIGGLLDLRDRYGMHLAVATGGSIARRIVAEKHPRFILAVACERDLSSGIQDVYPLPVYGLLNQRPHGPCYNTSIALPEVEEALRHFTLEAMLPDRPVSLQNRQQPL